MTSPGSSELKLWPKSCVSRSKVFAMALEQFLQKHEGKKLLEQLNGV